MTACFVTGTDTGVGKTRVAAGLLHLLARQGRGKHAVGMKPVASGAVWRGDVPIWEDVAQLAAASTTLPPLAWRSPYRFEMPVSPHLAAELAGVSIDLSVIHTAFLHLRDTAEHVVVEGAGGWRAPLTANQNMADLAKQLGIPVVLVVGIRLGCISHALLSAQAIVGDGVPLVGWVANCVEQDMLLLAENIDSIRTRLSAPLLGVLPWNPQAGLTEIADCLQLNGMCL
jgi:dethiobiotin synthetase